MARCLKQGGLEFQEKTHPSSVGVEWEDTGVQWAHACTWHGVWVCRVVLGGLFQNPTDYSK